MASWRRRPQAIASEWIAFRQAGVGYPALWLPGSKTDPTHQPTGRWHDEGKNYAQYLSLTSDGAWAELIRHYGYRTDQDLVKLRSNLWWFEVVETEIADLSSFTKAHECGLDPAILIDDEMADCQALARELRSAGFRGVLSASAALPGARNLTLFDPRREHEVRYTLGTFAAGNPRLDFYLTTAKLVDRGSPPAYLLADARYYETPHFEFELWKKEGNR